MKSIRNFFPTVGGNISNKRQKLSETASVAITSLSTDDSSHVPDIQSNVSKEPEVAVKGPIDVEATSSIDTDTKGSEPAAPVAVSESLPTQPKSSAALGWKPFDEMESGWKDRLAPEFHKPYFQRLLKFLDSESKSQTIYPPSSQIFTALNLCSYDKVKVVVIGQDPYHGPGQAHGLAFSVQKGVPLPPSLKNMVTELQNDPKTKIAKPSHGNLEHWSRQGVLLLNTCLTVRKGEANSHQKKGWEEFTDSVVRELRKKKGLVYLLWGKPAQTKCTGIDTKNNVILQSSHPSPLSAFKTSEAFMGSRIFSRCNDALESMGEEPIDWNII